jgi:hypothetical protein
MAKIVSIKIDVTKIDKERLFKAESGRVYLDAITFLEDESDQYGNNGMITQQVSKEERQNGIKGSILGNVKIVGQTDSTPSPQPSQSEPSNDDLPF